MDTIWQLTIPAALAAGIAHARAKANEGKPATIEQEVDGEVTQVPNPEYFATDFAYFQQRMFDVLNSWEAQRVADTAAPAPAPVPVSGVPQEVTRRQARQALIMSGKFDLVQPAIDAISDPVQRALMQSEWDDSQTFQRNRPALIQMATAIGLSSEDIDNLFTLAATLA